MSDKLSLKYAHEQELKSLGQEPNHKMRRYVEGCLHAAKTDLPSHAVHMEGNGSCGSVASASTPGVRYIITRVAPGYGQPSCTCMAQKTHEVCKHILAFLSAAGATDQQLIHCLGIFWGSNFGGFDALYEQMAATEALADAAQDFPAAGEEALELGEEG